MAGFKNNVPVRFPDLPPKSPSGADLIQVERAKATFDVKALSKFLNGEEWLSKLEKIVPILESEPVFDKTQRYFQGRDAKIRNAWEKDKRHLELAREHNWDKTDESIAHMLYDQPSPYRLHYIMFIPTLEGQCNEEQRKLFLEPSKRDEIIGCYAQTELGHGSNVQGLETTATYIPETNEFELHSPHLSSAKWWIGALGKTANYAVIMARLIIHGKDYGSHTFCAQIRSLEDHRPLPGLTIGDIGPKFGYNGVDNGFMMFDHFRIPHISMLAKYAQVKPGSGEYVKPINSKLSYGGMVHVRANIVNETGRALARASTVAVRYAAVRRQFVDAASPRKWGNETIETSVIDYTMVQYRLLPIIAQAYALLFTGQEMMRLYHLNMEAMKQGNFDILADLHASSSGLKSLTSFMAVDGIEECRRSCGGHGYSMFSGLGHFYQDYLPNMTVEGDNNMIYQQTSRYLLKTYRNVIAGTAKPSEHNLTFIYLSQYLQNPKAKCPANSANDFLNPEVILTAFGFRAAYGIAKVAEQIDHQGRSWNDALVDLHRISRAHCQYNIVRNFFITLQRANEGNNQQNISMAERKVLQSLAYLFALHTMEKDLSDFVMSSYFSPEQMDMIKQQVQSLLKVVRPDAVALVDAFALPDYMLHSALGRYDGNVYPALTKMAEQEPLNQTIVVDAYETCIKPMRENALKNKKDITAAKL
ncbi:acyl-CoA dehydrogenase/oxidase C-terminal [Zychaea mexicana]|uniref:acyl-CoA dehydrogenase/oxidase C-terminal n=1 Tax=Zychaea mexicana TaxID=64656 RepID=UPI0022FF0EA8|nr:acyl-CoA dehydrogenase/oxidase C-terminal [Zychaea mexicana]KAI9499269.1 acyl-CoA dehydrogenase/oxidase C-terminal [Zychaea mexicana]